MPKLKKINFKIVDIMQDSGPYNILADVISFHLELQEAASEEATGAVI